MALAGAEFPPGPVQVATKVVFEVKACLVVLTEYAFPSDSALMKYKTVPESLQLWFGHWMKRRIEKKNYL